MQPTFSDCMVQQQPYARMLHAKVCEYIQISYVFGEELQNMHFRLTCDGCMSCGSMGTNHVVSPQHVWQNFLLIMVNGV